MLSEHLRAYAVPVHNTFYGEDSLYVKELKTAARQTLESLGMQLIHTKDAGTENETEFWANFEPPGGEFLVGDGEYGCWVDDKWLAVGDVCTIFGQLTQSLTALEMEWRAMCGV